MSESTAGARVTCARPRRRSRRSGSQTGGWVLSSTHGAPVRVHFLPMPVTTSSRLRLGFRTAIFAGGTTRAGSLPCEPRLVARPTVAQTGGYLLFRSRSSDGRLPALRSSDGRLPALLRSCRGSSSSSPWGVRVTFKFNTGRSRLGHRCQCQTRILVTRIVAATRSSTQARTRAAAASESTLRAPLQVE